MYKIIYCLFDEGMPHCSQSPSISFLDYSKRRGFSLLLLKVSKCSSVTRGTEGMCGIKRAEFETTEQTKD